MATKDFRAGQLETSKIIGSGSISGTGAGIAIYSGSIASDREGGVSDAAMFNDVGSDVFLFVSGSANTRTGVTLFGGDLVVSGTLYAERQVIEVDETVSGSLFVSGAANIKEGLTVNSSQAGSTESDFVVYGTAGYRPIFVDVSSNAVLINADSDPITTKIHNSVDEVINVDSSGVVINEQSDNTIDFRVETNNLQGAIVVDASHEIVMLGSNEINAPGESLGSDVNLFFSGSSGTKDTAIKGTSVFAGDVVVSGSIYPGGATETLNIGSPDQTYLGIYSQEFYGDLEGAIRFNAKNDEGDTIQKGQVVYIKGVNGQTPTVALAACDDPSKMPAFGLAGETAANGANMQIVTFGDLSNINLNSLYVGSFTEGDVLYVATGSNFTSGSLTNIRPTGGSNLLQNMGFVVRDGGGSDGRVKVGGAGRSNATPNLNDGQIFIGDSTNCSTTASLGLNLAYASGSGAIIGVDGQPVQLQAGSSTALAVTGSIIIDDNGTDGKTEIYGDGKGYFYTYGNFAYNEPKLSFYRGRGTETSITSPVEGDDLGQLSWLGYSGGIHRTAAAIQVEADADHGASAQDTPGRLLFKTAQDGTSTLVTRQTIKNDGTTLFNLDSTNQTDSVFLVSGSIGGKGTEGTSVFGGDVFVSGSLYSEQDIRAFNNIRLSDLQGNTTPTVYFNAASSVYVQENNNQLIIESNNFLNTRFDQAALFNAESESNPIIVFSNSTAYGVKGALFNYNQDTDQDFSVSTTNQKRAIFVSSSDDSVMFHAEGLPPVASDTHFFVSGSQGGKNISGTAVFGGDVVISGSLHGGSPLQIGEYQPDVGTDVVLFVSGTSGENGGKGTTGGTTVIGNDLIVSGTYRGGYDALAGYETFQAVSDSYFFLTNPDDFGGSQIEATDSNFFFTGSIGSRGGGTPGTAVFGGDLHVSGAITADGGIPSYHYHSFAFQLTTGLGFVDWIGYHNLNLATNLDETTHSRWWVAPHDGFLKTAIISLTNPNFPGTGAETLQVSLYKNENSTAAGAVPTGHVTASIDQSVDFNDDGVTETHYRKIIDFTNTDLTLTGSNIFAAGDALSIGLRASTGLNQCSFTLVFELDTST